MSILVKRIVVGIVMIGSTLGASNYKLENQQTLNGIATTNNYVEFKDGTGWYLENEILEEGESYKVTINDKGTEDIEDDIIVSIEK